MSTNDPYWENLQRSFSSSTVSSYPVYPGNPCFYTTRVTYNWRTEEEKPGDESKKRSYDMRGLYDVYLCYGEDRKKPIIKKAEDVLAESDEDAKIKSGLMADVDKSWDADYLTFIVRKIGDIKVKPKPSEVKNV